MDNVNIPTADEKRAQIEAARPTNKLRLMKHIADAIEQWSTDGSIVVKLDRAEAVHTDTAIEHLRSLGYHVQRTGDARVGLTWLNIAIPKDDQTT